MGRLSGKVAIISGAGQGQGASHVRRFLAEGATVVATDIDGEKLRASAADLDAAVVATIEHDVRKEADWAAVVAFAEETYGHLDVLVNNAAIDLQCPILDMTEEQYRRVIDTNQVSVFLGMRAVAPAMEKAGGGSIVNISSITGTNMLGPLRVAYSASKFAINGMTKVAALEFAPLGIRVNTVMPGFVNTPMLAVATHTAERLAAIPLKRPAEPDEISHVVAFLASDESSYITGTEHLVDGGLARGF